MKIDLFDLEILAAWPIFDRLSENLFAPERIEWLRDHVTFRDAFVFTEEYMPYPYVVYPVTEEYEHDLSNFDGYWLGVNDEDPELYRDRRHRIKNPRHIEGMLYPIWESGEESYSVVDLEIYKKFQHVNYSDEELAALVDALDEQYHECSDYAECNEHIFIYKIYLNKEKTKFYYFGHITEDGSLKKKQEKSFWSPQDPFSDLSFFDFLMVCMTGGAWLLVVDRYKNK